MYQYVQVDTSTIYSVYLFLPTFCTSFNKTPSVMNLILVSSVTFPSYLIWYDTSLEYERERKISQIWAIPLTAWEVNVNLWHHRYLCRPWRCTHRLLRFISVATLYDILMAATLLGSVTAMMPSPLKSKNKQINSTSIFTSSKVFSKDIQDLTWFVIECDLFMVCHLHAKTHG